VNCGVKRRLSPTRYPPLALVVPSLQIQGLTCTGNFVGEVSISFLRCFVAKHMYAVKSTCEKQRKWLSVCMVGIDSTFIFFSPISTGLTFFAALKNEYRNPQLIKTKRDEQPRFSSLIGNIILAYPLAKRRRNWNENKVTINKINYLHFCFTILCSLCIIAHISSPLKLVQ
jgi:hypothetical protein